jgi:hypothetical protein
VLGHAVAKPRELIGLACESLRSTIGRPMLGRPHAPERVRVASPELAEALRAGQSRVEVVCAPTPEIDAVLAAMRERMTDEAETEPSYLSPEVDPAAVAAFFRTAAALFRAKPWKTVPSDQSLFSVSIEKLGVTEAALLVTGQMGQGLGLIRFSGIDDFDAYLDAADAVEHGEEPTMPPHFALNFERGAELSPALRKEIAEHHWEVAGAEAYPKLVAVDEDLVARPPTVEEIAIAEAIALALPKVLEDEKALLAAWNGGEPVARTLVVPTHAGDVEVSLRAPYEREPSEYKPPYDVLAALAIPASARLPSLGSEAQPIDRTAARAKKALARPPARRARRTDDASRPLFVDRRPPARARPRGARPRPGRATAPEARPGASDRRSARGGRASRHVLERERACFEALGVPAGQGAERAEEANARTGRLPRRCSRL